MNKLNSALIQKPWILLVIVLVGWFLGTATGYALAYVVDGAQNVFDIYADLTILGWIVGVSSVVATLLNSANVVRLGFERWVVTHLTIGVVGVASLISANVWERHQTYQSNGVGFEEFGNRALLVSHCRDTNPYIMSDMEPKDIRLISASGTWYLDSLEVMPEKYMNLKERALRDTNRGFLNKRH